MRVKVNRAEFLKRLKIVENSIDENKIKPIISCTYVEIRDNTMIFCGTNLETTITTHMPKEMIEIEEPGQMVFQHQLIEEYLKQLKDEMIEFILVDRTLTILGEDSSTEFSLMDSEDYPRLLAYENIDNTKENFCLESHVLAGIFEKVKYAAATSTDNMQVNCVKLEGAGNTLKFISTDTFRLTYLETQVGEVEGNLEISIPLNTVEAVTKLLRSISNTKLCFYFINNQIFFKTEDVLVMSRVIDLSYPEYEIILENKTYNKKLTINVGEILKMLKRTIIFVRNNSESKYGATFELENNLMKINGVSDIAKINEEAQVDYIGDPLRISLNTKFLVEFIQNLEKDNFVTLEFTESNGPVKIRKENDKNYIYILMPLALRD